MVPGACQDSLDPRYLVCHICDALKSAIFHNASFKCVFEARTKRHVTFLSLLLRETEGLMVWPDFPVKKDTE